MTTKFLEVFDQKIAELEEELRSVRAARSTYLARVPIEKQNGTRAEKMIETIIALLRERNGEMPTKELFALVLSLREFPGKRTPESRFRTSLKLGVKNGRITLVDVGPTKELSGSVRLVGVAH
jgi:hypothetical protein